MPIVRHLLNLLIALALAGPVLSFAQTYSASSEPYAWVSTAGHTNVTWNLASCTGGGASVDDDITAELPLGFTFRFGSVNYTTARVMSNGRLQFNNTFCYPGTASTGPPPTYTLPLPDANMVRVMRIYGSDLDSSGGGTVTYASRGSAPNRSFVVTWTNVREWGQGSSRFNLQIVLYENGDFVYQFGSSSNPSGGKAQIGWQLTTADYALYSFTNIGSLAGTALRWSPPRVTISGTVYEDINYGGGGGRSKGAALAAAGSVRPNARVELYSVSAGTATFSSATTSDASGNYSFTVSSASTWAVRVVSSSVLASRTGATAALLPVLTARSEWNTNAAWQVSDHVGGINPALGDAPAASTGAVFNTSTGVFSAGVSGTAQAF